MNNPPHIEVTPDFPKIELASLFCWCESQWDLIADDDVSAERDEWITYQLERLNHTELMTFGVYRNGEIAGYVEAAVSDPLQYSPDGFLSRLLPDTVAVVQAVFQKQMWGLAYTVPAMRMALSHIFRHEVDQVKVGQVIFPVYAYNDPIKKLYSAIEAKNVGRVASIIGEMSAQSADGEPIHVETFILPAAEWRKNNAAFIASYEPQEVAVGAEADLDHYQNARRQL